MSVRVLLRPIKGFRLISLSFTYAMGAGLTHYFGVQVDWQVLSAGIFFLCSFMLGFDYLQAMQQVNDQHFQLEGVSPREIQQIRLGLGVIAATLMTGAVTIMTGWMINGILWQGLTVLLVGALFIGGAYILEGQSEKFRPFHPLFETVFVVILPPALGYFLQTQQMHRFLTMVVLGSVPLYMAFILLSQLIHFGEDRRKDILTTVTAMGWEAAMVLHNGSILLGFMLFALVALLGFPWRLIWPIFLTLPLGLLAIWLMERVRRGHKPLWPIMQFASGATFLVPVYLLVLKFWIG